MKSEGSEPVVKMKRFSLAKITGIDEHFSRNDRWVAGSIFGWNMLWCAVVAVGSLVYLAHRWSDDGWVNFWFTAGITVNLIVGVPVCIWFTIGCARDMKVFFQRLKLERVDARDDGTVPERQNLDETKPDGEKVAGAPGRKGR